MLGLAVSELCPTVPTVRADFAYPKNGRYAYRRCLRGGLEAVTQGPNESRIGRDEGCYHA